MNIEQLRAAAEAALERAKKARTAIDEIDPATASDDDVTAAETELADAVAEVERTKKNLETRVAQDKILGAAPVEVPAPAATRQPATAKGELRSERMYRPDASAQHGQAMFFRDLALMNGGDVEARERLERNNREGAELRAGLNQTATTAGEFIAPVWYIDQFAAKLRAGRPTVDAIGTKPLPAGTNSLNVPAITTGATEAVQTDGGSVSNTDWVTASITAQVQTIAGRSVASYQLVDLSQPGIDQIIASDLVADYARLFDATVVNGSVANAKGILNVTGVNAVTYTSASPKQTSATVADSFWNQLIFAKNAIDKGAFVPTDFAIMHPSTWNWYLSGLDSQLRPLAVGLGGMPGFNGTSVDDVGAAQGFSGYTNFGLPVVADANVPVNLGGGTNQAPTVLMNRRGFDIWESMPTFKAADQTSATTLQYQFILYGYYAVMSRQPKMISVINGTGSIVQSGF